MTPVCTRSENMRRIRSSNTQPELILRGALHASGLRYRLHRNDLPGKPDIVFVRPRVAVFVHGCFWHRHAGCRRCTRPRTNTSYWDRKFLLNVARDDRVTRELRDAGWAVEIVWECDVRKSAAPIVRRIGRLLRKKRGVRFAVKTLRSPSAT